MAKKIRFPLKMKNGAEVRTLDELKENFDLESILGYFTDGKLAKWLSVRYYDEKVESVSLLSSDMPDLNAKLCEILEVEYQSENDDTDIEFIARRREKLRILSAFTDNKDILNNIDMVAITQEELYDILDNKPEKVYLYGDIFFIPFRAKNVRYVGIDNHSASNEMITSGSCPINNQPYIKLDEKYLPCDYEASGIVFTNVIYDESIFLTAFSEFTSGNYTRAFPYIKIKAELGVAFAQLVLGDMYLYGKGVTKNYSEAFKWFKEAAEQGDAYAQLLLGDMYLKEKGVAKNYSEAFKWFKEAAEQGNAPAQYNLGVMYYNGEGVAQNYTEAFKWFKEAAEQGDAYAQCTLGYMYSNGDGVEQDNAKAVELYRKAAAQGNEIAINNLKTFGVSL